MLVCKNCQCSKCHGSGGWEKISCADVNGSETTPSYNETKYNTRQLPTEHLYDHRARYIGMKTSSQNITTIIYHPSSTNQTFQLKGNLCSDCHATGKDSDKRNQNFWCHDCWGSSLILHGTLSLYMTPILTLGSIFLPSRWPWFPLSSHFKWGLGVGIGWLALSQVYLLYRESQFYEKPSKNKSSH